MTNFPSTTDHRAVQRRIGDAERDRCVEDLSRSFSVGRLSQSEFERRSLLALEAETLSDLEVLVQDLDETQPTAEVAAKSSSRALVLRPAGLAKLALFLAFVGAVSFIGCEGDMDVWFGWWLFGSVAGGLGALLARGRRVSR